MHIDMLYWCLSNHSKMSRMLFCEHFIWKNRKWYQPITKKKKKQVNGHCFGVIIYNVSLQLVRFFHSKYFHIFCFYMYIECHVSFFCLFQKPSSHFRPESSSPKKSRREKKNMKTCLQTKCIFTYSVLPEC